MQVPEPKLNLIFASNSLGCFVFFSDILPPRRVSPYFQNFVTIKNLNLKLKFSFNILLHKIRRLHRNILPCRQKTYAIIDKRHIQKDAGAL
jgi:hypothetical protein